MLLLLLFLWRCVSVYAVACSVPAIRPLLGIYIYIYPAGWSSSASSWLFDACETRTSSNLNVIHIEHKPSLHRQFLIVCHWVFFYHHQKLSRNARKITTTTRAMSEEKYVTETWYYASLLVITRESDVQMAITEWEYAKYYTNIGSCCVFCIGTFENRHSFVVWTNKIVFVQPMETKCIFSGNIFTNAECGLLKQQAYQAKY